MASPPVEDRPSISDLVHRLVAQGGAFVKAELALYRAQAGQKAASAGVVAGLIGGGVMLAQAAVVALLVGILFAIAVSLGFLWATLIVVVIAFAVVALLFKLAFDRVNAMVKPGDDA